VRIFNEGIKKIVFGEYFNMELIGKFPSSLEHVEFGFEFKNGGVPLLPDIFPMTLKTFVIKSVIRARKFPTLQQINQYGHK